MHRLQHPYPSVQRGSAVSYGGSQTWSARRDLRLCGCGAIAMTDLALYLARYHGYDGPALPVPAPLEDYDALCSRLQRRYLPMIPPFGINGLSLAAGISLYCRLRKIPLQAFWGVRTKNFWTAMTDMLDRDLPVIFSVGQNLPCIWQKQTLNLYKQTGDGIYTAVSRVRAHYMTATALDDTWMTVSSWGKQYYIHRDEYEQYGRKHSIALVNNLVWLRPMDQTHRAVP